MMFPPTRLDLTAFPYTIPGALVTLYPGAWLVVSSSVLFELITPHLPKFVHSLSDPSKSGRPLTGLETSEPGE